MKIAQITSVYVSVPPKTYGGTERIVYHLCRQLERRGHQVELFASGDSQAGCALHSVVAVASQDDPNSTFYLEKEFDAVHLRPDLVVLHGDPAHEVVDFAEFSKAELVVVGVRRRQGQTRAVGGRMATRVLRKADCSVLVVPTLLREAAG